MKNLRDHGLTPENIIKTEESKIEELIRSVGFYKRKAQFVISFIECNGELFCNCFFRYIKETTQVLISKYNNDIPKTIEEIIKLKGVGPKMAFLTANMAWKSNFGIGVDVHVHRITNRLGWVETKTPEQTRMVKTYF